MKVHGGYDSMNKKNRLDKKAKLIEKIKEFRLFDDDFMSRVFYQNI